MAKPVQETVASTDLITIETLKAADVFKPGAVERLISDVEAKVRAIPAADHTTEKGRTEIKALAYKVTRSKTALDELGKNHVAELKKAAGVVDADRRIIRDRLDALKDEVRRPVTEYEAAEEMRIGHHTIRMEALQALDTFAIGEETITEVDTRLSKLSALQKFDWEEFTAGASRLIGRLSTSLPTLRAKLVKQEEEKAELDRLRKAEAERQEAERIAQTERDRVEREDRIAARAYQEAKDKAAEDSRHAEAERLAAIARAEKAERDAKEAADRAEADKATALERAEHDRTTAIAQALADARHQEDDLKAAAEAATRKREKDKAHLMRINNEALTDLMEVGGITENQGKLIVIAIAGGNVANIYIQY